jgi:arylsulfatase A-like enzyme
MDRPIAALIKDLKQRGLLDTTLVHWGGEMGRLPVIQNNAGPDKVGRDHNTYGFSMWLAGGGIRGGMTFGNTDDFGHKAVENVVNHYDYHATLLHLFGIDPEQLTFEQNNRKRSLLEGQGRVVHEILS